MHVQVGGVLAVGAELAGWIVGLSHLAREHIWIFCWGWNVLIGRVTFGITYTACRHSDQVLDWWKMMYGWMNRWADLWKHEKKAHQWILSLRVQ